MKLLFVISISLALAMSIPVEANSAGREEMAYAQKKKTSPDPVISVTGNRLKVENALPGSKLEIFSVVGIKVMEIEIKYSEGEYPLNIAKGYYIVRLGETVRKIVVR